MFCLFCSLAVRPKANRQFPIFDARFRGELRVSQGSKSRSTTNV
jgi:hypothetical protein